MNAASLPITWTAILYTRYARRFKRLRYLIRILTFKRCSSNENLPSWPQGAVIFVSHDETFVNNVLNREGRPALEEIAGLAERSVAAFGGMEGAPAGELWVLSKRALRRFEGTFSEYKRSVSRSVKATASRG